MRMYRPIESNSADSENKVPVDNLLQKLHKNWEHIQLVATKEKGNNIKKKHTSNILDITENRISDLFSTHTPLGIESVSRIKRNTMPQKC